MEIYFIFCYDTGMPTQFTDKVSSLKLTASERALVNFLLNNPEMISSIKLTDLAKVSYVSGPTISRFVQKMGYKNYSDFRVSFIKEISSSTLDDTPINYDLPISPDMSVFDIEKTIANMMHLVIDETVNLNNSKMINDAVEMINRCSSIAVYGSFTYLSFANSFKYNMERIGKKVEILNNEGQYLFSAIRTTPDVLSIVISYSGSTISKNLAKDVIPILKKDNLPAILITSADNTIDYDAFQCILNLSNKQKFDIYFSPLTGELSLFVILYILYACCYENNYQVNLDNIKKAIMRAKNI